MPHRRVFRIPLAGADRSHYDLASVDADPRLDRRPAFSAQARGVMPQFVLKAKRRIERPLGMVLMRDWSPEQCEDAITGRLHYVAVVMVNCIDHQLQGGINQGPRFFRIEAL